MSVSKDRAEQGGDSSLWGEMMSMMARGVLGMQEHPTRWPLLFETFDAYRELFNRQWTQQPGDMMGQQMSFWQQHQELWQNFLLRMAGKAAPELVQASKGDRRFEAQDWHDHPWFSYLQQTYLLISQQLMQMLDQVQGMDEKTLQRLRFMTRQWVSAMAPSNFLWSNPEMLRLTMESGGQNLVKGMQQLVEDMKNSADTLNITMTDRSAFEIGVDLATTPGKVVFRNELIELIQYAPRSEQVYERPLLIVPPWINKFYVLDLSARQSLARWICEQGHTVFMISWVNPGREMHDMGIEDYMQRGLLAALDVLQEQTGIADANVLGYCAGGILLSITLAWLAARGQSQRIASATQLATLADFSDTGDIGVFIDDAILNALEQELDRQGVLDGRMLAVTFSILRENDLYWNYYIQNYLKGERPVPFDMLYWNTDSTNVAAAVHKFFLRQLYTDNLLRQPGALTIAGEKIDLRQVRTPVFVYASLQDHIAKWPGCYASTQLYAGPVEFVLGESGHVAGVLNAPGGRYGHYRHEALPAQASEWFAQAQYHAGESWWLPWSQWQAAYGGQKVVARTPLRDLGDAPGSYVRVSAAQALSA